MASTKRKSFLWLVSLFTIVICVTIAYIYIPRTVENQNFSPRSVKQNSLHSEKLTDENCIPTCDTKECVMQAKSLLSHIDSSVDPCDNAHSFLCGEFVKKIAPEESQKLLDITTQKLWIAVKNILENIQAEPGSPSANLKIVYDSCMDYGSSELQGSMSFQKFLEDNLGIANWPYLDSDFKFADSRISKLLGKIAFLGKFPVLYIDVPYEETDYTYSIYNSVSGANVTEIKSVAVHALDYFDLAQEDIEIIASDIEYVMKSIADLQESLNDGECEGNCTTPKYVNCSNLNAEKWRLLCDTVEAFHDEVMKYRGGEKREAIVLEVHDPSYTVKDLLLMMDSLPHKSLANYFAFNFLYKFLEEINFYFRLTKLKIDNSEHFRNKVQPEMWKNCIKWINKNMRLILAKEFFRQYLTNPIIEQVFNFHKEFRSDIIKIIELQEWIPPERKLRIINQLENATLNIREMKDILENSTSLDLIEGYYQMVHPTKESFFNNVLQYEKINDFMRVQPYDSEILKAYTMIEQTRLEVGANTNMQEINMFYGIFVPPYYTPNLRRDINRLSHALILGHEIGHTTAFMLEEPTLNDTEPISEFQEAKECFENQFSKFKFDILKENLNGTRYYVENLADSVGTTLIDKILDEYESAEQMQFLLPGLDYSTNQFLYMSAFQLFCSKDNLKSEKHSQEEDSHAPPKFRIIGPLQNSRSYSRHFQCSEGSYMNPVKKCSLLSNS